MNTHIARRADLSETFPCLYCCANVQCSWPAFGSRSHHPWAREDISESWLLYLFFLRYTSCHFSLSKLSVSTENQPFRRQLLSETYSLFRAEGVKSALGYFTRPIGRLISQVPFLNFRILFLTLGKNDESCFTSRIGERNLLRLAGCKFLLVLLGIDGFT